MTIDHQPYYCEENVYRLAGRADLIRHPAEVVFVSNARRQVACWHQQAAAPGEPLVWDYHVVLLERAPDGPLLWDLDTRLGAPVPAALWVAETFQDPSWVRAPFHPRFRVAPAPLFLATFATDRSHMRVGTRWRRPPPPWDPPGAPGMNLDAWIDTTTDGPGLTFDRSGFLAHLEG
jgi:hypothetical protein